MKTFKLYFLLLIALSFLGGVKVQKSNSTDDSIIKNGNSLYLSHTIVVKFKDDLNGNIISFRNSFSVHPIFRELKINKLERLFNDNNLKSNSVDLSKIYIIQYGENIDPAELSMKLKTDKNIIFSEPHFVYVTDFNPNDPNINLQYYLNKCSVLTGWDNSKGDSTVVIGIIDTGIYWMHPDLSLNIWMNKKEIPNNGIDDDKNGFIDDIRGWDFGGTNGNPDNDPSEDQADHGTLIGGLASASTNNNIGIAGVGFNCKIMAVKTTRNDVRDPISGKPYIIYGYEGIKYAADNGAKIINCSWGGSGYSVLGQETITYATEKGSLVIAAAGNENSSLDHYPSDYQNCFSVAATDSTDIRASYSNYNYNVDVCAPGTNVYSTWFLNSYGYASGTSLSSPIVAGIAGLVLAKYPTLSPEQLGEKIRVSADNIYSINPTYQYKLGKGRANANNALLDLDNKSVREKSFFLNDNSPLGNGNGVLEPNESADILVNFKNILANTTNLSISMTSLTSGISVINSSFSAGIKQSGEVFNNNNSPFRISAGSNLPNDLLVQLLLTFTDNAYNDFQVITFYANPTYVQANNNQIDVTIGSQGNLAFNDYPGNLKGKGLKYLSSSNLLFEGSLIIATSETKISDRARGYNPSVQNSDFISLEPIKLFKPGNKSDIQTLSIFNDDGAGSNKLGIKTVLNSYQYSEDPNTDFILLHYKFINTSGAIANNFFAGLFFDWDLLSTGQDDFASWDNEAKFGYVYNVTRAIPYYVGCGLVSDDKYNYRAILNPGGDGFWGIYDNFTDAKKWEAISGGLTKITAGAGDISHLVSAGPYSIAVNDTLNVVFAIAGGDTITDLRSHFYLAKSKWNYIATNVDNEKQLPTSFSLFQNYPNPFNPSTIIEYGVGSRENAVSGKEYVVLKIYDVLGREIETLVNEQKTAGKYSVEWNAAKYSSGIYYYKLKAGDFRSIKKMMLVK